MGLDTVVKKAAVTAFAAVSDLLQSITYRQVGVSGYDPAGGEVSDASFTDITVSVLIETYNDREIDDIKILDSDRKLSVPSLTLGASVTPKIGDQVFLGSATDAHSTDNKWRVEFVETDPATALWILRIRQ